MSANRMEPRYLSISTNVNAAAGGGHNGRRQGRPQLCEASADGLGGQKRAVLRCVTLRRIYNFAVTFSRAALLQQRLRMAAQSVHDA